MGDIKQLYTGYIVIKNVYYKKRPHIVTIKLCDNICILHQLSCFGIILCDSMLFLPYSMFSTIQC